MEYEVALEKESQEGRTSEEANRPGGQTQCQKVRRIEEEGWRRKD